MRFRALTVLGIGLYLGSVVLFNLKLIALLQAGTCASGNQPFVIARPCPEGTEWDAILLVASILGLFISLGVLLARGRPPEGYRISSFAWPLAWWGIFFAGSGAVALLYSLTADLLASDAELGGIIVGITFLILGVPALALLAIGVRSGFRPRKTRGLLKAFYDSQTPASAPEPRTAPAANPDRSTERDADRFSDDTITRLERLQSLRASGALSEAEFEAQKARVLSS